MSSKAKLNWAMDVVIAAAFALSVLSGIVMLFVPGGYQGGRNPNYGATTLFLSHAAWDALHIWSSLVLVAGVALHVALHWKWIVCMLRGSLAKERRPFAPQGGEDTLTGDGAELRASLHSKQTPKECPVTVEQVA